MSEPTFADVDALVGPATPHFAYQLRARVRELVRDLPEEHEVRKYADAKIELLDHRSEDKVLWKNDQYRFAENYQINLESTDAFDQETCRTAQGIPQRDSTLHMAGW